MLIKIIFIIFVTLLTKQRKIMAINKLQIIRSDVPTGIHSNVKKWAYDNKINGKSLDTEKKVYAELIRLGHLAYKEKSKNNV